MEKPYRKYFLQTQSRLINYQHEREKSNRTKISSIFFINKKNASKIKDPQEQRQSIRDFISLQVYEAITQLKMIE